jgi:ribosome-binding ATPase
MKLSIGIVGLPNVGKSTLFKILTAQEIHIANYPFATIDPNVGVVPVPDERLATLTKLSASKKTIPAVVEFFDIAGLVKGANKGEGLGNQFLANIREVSAILQLVRCFKHDDIIHVEGGVDPVRDFEIVKTELILKDLETVEKRLPKAEADARSRSKDAIAEVEALGRIKARLERGEFLRRGNAPLDEHAPETKFIRGMNLLTSKPQLFLLNGTEADVTPELLELIVANGAGYVIADLSVAEHVPEIIREAYRVLNLVSFFTTGEDESRAWTIERGWRAPQAAGVIHTDFEQKFIRAEVVSYPKLVEAGGWGQAKQRGWLRLEGKEYVVEDGDVMVIRHG